MKILHISALPLWSMDGKGGMPSLLETLKGHIREGIEIELIIPEYDLFSHGFEKLKTENDFGLKVHIARSPWLVPIKKVRKSIIDKRGKEEIPFVLRWMINFSIFIMLTITMTVKGFKINKNFGADMIYSHNQYSCLAGFFIGKIFKIYNITRLYGTFLADLMKKPFVSLRYPVSAAGYLVPSNLLICTNDGTRGDIVAEKFGTKRKRFRFWQNGISPPVKIKKNSKILEKYRIKKDSILVISCSRLSSWKRIDRILKAVKYCCDKGLDLKLFMAGDGPESENLKKLAGELDIEENTFFPGALAHQEIWQLMNEADIFMITNDVTNRCNPLFEAVFAGLPIVSVNDPSTSDILHQDKNALLSEKDDEENLGKNLEKLCIDEVLRKRLSKNQIDFSKSFWTWEERIREETLSLKALL